MKKKSRVLKDHKQKKKVLVPPLLDVMGDKRKSYSWVKELIPEFIWIAFLQKKLGLNLGLDIATYVGQKAEEVCKKPSPPIFAKASSFSELSSEEQKALVAALEEDGKILTIREGLRGLLELLPTYPLAFLFQDCEGKDEICDEAVEVLNALYDRYSIISTHTQATAIGLGVTQNRIHFSSEISILSNFEALNDYPNTDESEMVASSIRAAIGMFMMVDNEQPQAIDNPWIEEFWTRVSGIGDCMVTEEPNNYGDTEPEDELGKMVFRFCKAAEEELSERISAWGFDLNEAEKYEVIGGLLARQTTLAIDLAMSPMSWTPSASPLFHRAMADIFIALSWILKNPQERSMKFIETGIGDVKLDVAHRKKRIEEEGEESDPRELKMIEIYEQWISNQKIEAMVEVNLANWSSITTRQMAIEADCLDFYNYVYQSFSAAVHPSWVHISFHNLHFCKNPAHRGHRVPLIPDYQPQPYFLYLSAKYLQKAYAKFDDETGIKTTSISAFDQLYDDIYGEEDSS